MKNNLKPKYIPEEFLIATKYGWVDTRTNEVLVAIPNLDKRLKEFDSIKNESNEKVETDDKKNQLEEISNGEVETKIDEILNEPVDEKVEDKPKPKRRGRPAKNK